MCNFIFVNLFNFNTNYELHVYVMYPIANSQFVKYMYTVEIKLHVHVWYMYLHVKPYNLSRISECVKLRIL